MWTFFRQWLRKPLSTAAVSPSSRYLAKRMVAALPTGSRRVIELGGGTGTFTRALLGHGIALDDLLVIEFNPNLHAYLQKRFPGLAVVQADARALGQVEAVRDFAAKAPVDAVVSGLGLLSMSRPTQTAILEGAFDLLGDNGVFVQFTYGPLAPVAGEVMRRLGLRVQRHGFTLLNIPPASVFVFSRDRTAAGAHAA